MCFGLKWLWRVSSSCQIRCTGWHEAVWLPVLTVLSEGIALWLYKQSYHCVLDCFILISQFVCDTGWRTSVTKGKCEGKSCKQNVHSIICDLIWIRLHAHWFSIIILIIIIIPFSDEDIGGASQGRHEIFCLDVVTQRNWGLAAYTKKFK